jgi:hypothetical protein
MTRSNHRKASPAKSTAAVPPNYWDYIRVDALLALQGGLEGDEGQLSNDEVLFITAHQVFELWFKLILRELRSLRDFFHRDPVEDQHLARAVESIRRVVTLYQRCAAHFPVLETMSTRSYLAVPRQALAGERLPERADAPDRDRARAPGRATYRPRVRRELPRRAALARRHGVARPAARS